MFMSIIYFEGRLSASLKLMDAATDSCAQRVHAGMVKGYRSTIASLRAANGIASMAEDGDAAASQETN
jgi:hypothetical protein